MRCLSWLMETGMPMQIWRRPGWECQVWGWFLLLLFVGHSFIVRSFVWSALVHHRRLKPEIYGGRCVPEPHPNGLKNSRCKSQMALLQSGIHIFPSRSKVEPTYRMEVLHDPTFPITIYVAESLALGPVICSPVRWDGGMVNSSPAVPEIGLGFLTQPTAWSVFLSICLLWPCPAQGRDVRSLASWFLQYIILKMPKNRSILFEPLLVKQHKGMILQNNSWRTVSHSAKWPQCPTVPVPSCHTHFKRHLQKKFIKTILQSIHLLSTWNGWCLYYRKL